MHCPSCGYCQYCGRSNQISYQYYPYNYPYQGQMQYGQNHQLGPTSGQFTLGQTRGQQTQIQGSLQSVPITCQHKKE